MRGYYEIEQRLQGYKENVTNLCRVQSCNQREYVNAIVQVTPSMAECINKHGSGRVLTLNGASLFLYNPMLISVGQKGGL